MREITIVLWETNVDIVAFSLLGNVHDLQLQRLSITFLRAHGLEVRCLGAVNEVRMKRFLPEVLPAY
jgi:hypothetical protein